jgi:glycerophosphoryl diester phosphodiesterase
MESECQIGYTHSDLTNILLDPAARPIIAHRGASADAPENTLEAFRLARGQGCDAFEFDVRTTRDGVPVLMHDPVVDRTTDRSGSVASMTLAELQAADAGARFTAPDGSHPFRGTGVRAPTLVEVLRAFPDMPMLIEIKAREAQDAVAKVLLDERAPGRCVVASFKPGAMQAFRRPPFLTGASRSDAAALYWRIRLGLRSPEPRCLCYAMPYRWKNRIEIPLPRFIAEARRHGRPVHVWTVDDADLARMLWARGAAGMITNKPGEMVAVRDGRTVGRSGGQ